MLPWYKSILSLLDASPSTGPWVLETWAGLPAVSLQSVTKEPIHYRQAGCCRGRHFLTPHPSFSTVGLCQLNSLNHSFLIYKIRIQHLPHKVTVRIQKTIQYTHSALWLAHGKQATNQWRWTLSYNYTNSVSRVSF